MYCEPRNSGRINSSIQKNNIVIARYLHQKGADVNKNEVNGYTPVFWAAQEGKKRLELLDNVKELGVELNQTSKRGDKRMPQSGWYGHTRTICVKMSARVGSDLLQAAVMQPEVEGWALVGSSQ